MVMIAMAAKVTLKGGSSPSSTNRFVHEYIVVRVEIATAFVSTNTKVSYNARVNLPAVIVVDSHGRVVVG